MTESQQASEQQGGEPPERELLRVRQDSKGSVSYLLPPDLVEYHNLEHKDSIEYTLEIQSTAKVSGPALALRATRVDQRKSNTRQVSILETGKASIRLPLILFAERGLLDAVEEEDLYLFLFSESPGEFVLLVAHEKMALDSYQTDSTADDSGQTDTRTSMFGPSVGAVEQQEPADMASPEERVAIKKQPFNPTVSGPETQFYTARFYFPVIFNDLLSDETVVRVRPVAVDGELAIRLDVGDEDEFDADGLGYSRVWTDSVRVKDDDTPRVTTTVRYRMNFPLFYAVATEWAEINDDGEMVSDDTVVVVEREGGLLIHEDV